MIKARDIVIHKLTCNSGNAFVRNNVMQGCFFASFKERRRLYMLSVNSCNTTQHPETLLVTYGSILMLDAF
jgi:hypothetical protein